MAPVRDNDRRKHSRRHHLGGHYRSVQGILEHQRNALHPDDELRCHSARRILPQGGWPGAQIYFDTAYAALVCLLLAALLGLAWHWNIRLRAAVPAVLLTAALAIGAGNALSRDVVRVELVGSKMAPAVILSQNDRAVVLYRGGQTTRKAVETALERRSIRTVEALIDLRMDPQEPCTLRAEQIVRAARLAANTTQTLRTDTVSLEVLRTQTGCECGSPSRGSRL